MRRMAIFVDGANLFYAQRDALGWRIDWKRLLAHYRQNYEVVAAHYYRALRASPSDEERAFGRMLMTSGYTIREKMLKEIFDKYAGEIVWKGNLDIELAIDALTSEARFDTCLLVSGDGDFVPLVEALRQRGKVVLVASTPGTIALELRGAVGLDFQDLQDLRPQIEYLTSPRTRSTEGNSGRIGVSHSVASGSATSISVANEDRRVVWGSGGTAISPGDRFEATVKQVVSFGAYVSIADEVAAFLPTANLRVSRFVADPVAIINIGERYAVAVVDIDYTHSPPRITVELTNASDIQTLQRRLDDLRPPFESIPGDGEFELEVQAVKHYGAFLRNPWDAKILLHASMIDLGQISDCAEIMRCGDKVRVRLMGKERTADGVRISIALADEAYRGVLKERMTTVSTRIR